MIAVIRSARRRFLARIAILAVTALYAEPQRADNRHALARNVRRSFPHPYDAVALGRRWLDTRSVPPDLTSLVRELFADNPAWEYALTRPAAVRRLSAVMNQADFDSGRVVELDGWILARTEVRLCAIAAFGEKLSRHDLSCAAFRT